MILFSCAHIYTCFTVFHDFNFLCTLISFQLLDFRPIITKDENCSVDGTFGSSDL